MEQTPVHPEMTSVGYTLGRLFAVYEYAQSAAGGKSRKTSLGERYYSTASAAPQAIFPSLIRRATVYLSTIEADRPRLRIYLDQTLSTIMEQLTMTDGNFPVSLNAAEQAMFAMGYFRERHTPRERSPL